MYTLTRVATALLSGAVAASLLVGGGAQAAAPRSSAAGHGATWLSDQLTDGLIHNPTFGGFDDYGLSIDTAFGLKAIGGHPKAVARIRSAMTHHVSDYTTDASFGLTDEFAGADAKLLVFAQSTGGGATDFGATNLVTTLEDRVITSGPAAGRIQDVVDPSSTSGDSANAIGQVFAVRGLLAAHDPLAGAALRYLLLQQCAKGFFRLDLGKATSSHQACTSASTPDNDVTSLAVVELWKFRKGHATLRAGLHDAVGWLERQQKDNGSFGGSGPTAASNTNSTGLAAGALGTSGRCSLAGRAASWIEKLQVGGHLKGTPLQGERGAVAYDGADLRLGEQKGITNKKQDAWRRATSQAAPGLLFLGGRHCR